MYSVNVQGNIDYNRNIQMRFALRLQNIENKDKQVLLGETLGK